MEKTEYVNFGDLARKTLNMQCQYASRYLTGVGGFPNLSDGIRWRALDRGDYHTYEIHVEDVVTFVSRIRGYKLYVLEEQMKGEANA